MYSLRFSAAVAVVAYIGLIMADRHGRVADPRWNLTAVNCYKGGTGFFGGRRERQQRKLLFVFCFQVTRPPRESLPFLDSLRTHSSAWDCAQLHSYSTLPYCCLVRLTGSASVAVGLSPQSSFVRSREIEAN